MIFQERKLFKVQTFYPSEPFKLPMPCYFVPLYSIIEDYPITGVLFAVFYENYWPNIEFPY